MGRAMLIICAGTLVALGFTGIGTTQQGLQMTMTSSSYANLVHAKNSAQTAIQIAMNHMNGDPDWEENNATEAHPWTPVIDGDEVTLWVEVMASGATSMDADTIRIVSRSTSVGESAEVVSVYQKASLHYVPEFKSAVSFATADFMFDIGGDANISGADESATCPDKPGIAVQDSASLDKVDDFPAYTEGDPAVAIDEDLTYEPVDELIARLDAMPGVVHLSGNYKGDMGTVDNPGVFFVDDPTKLTGGISEGYGIMVVRTDGELDYEGELEIAGNFKFNGLVIFENAWNFKARGTPMISGSVLVGNPQCDEGGPDCSTLDADLNGTVDIKYNCYNESYAQRAAAGLLNQNQYKRITTFE